MSAKGWVYIISNKAMPDVLKIGFSMKDPALRALELAGTGVPHQYEVEYEVLVEAPRDVERQAHALLRSQREAKEWFRCSLHVAVGAIRSIAINRIVENFYGEEATKEKFIRLASENLPESLIALSRNSACTDGMFADVFEAIELDEGIQERIASDVTCPNRLLENIYRLFGTAKVIRAILGNPNVDPSLLTEIALDFEQDEESDVTSEWIQLLISHPSTPTELLLDYQFHGWDASKNKNFSYWKYAEKLQKYVEIGGTDVLFQVASDTYCPLPLLRRLADDLCVDVRYAVAANVNTPPDILIRLACDDPVEDVRIAAWNHPRNPLSLAKSITTSSGRLAQLARHHNASVRALVAGNPNAPKDSIYALSKDSNISVRDALFAQRELPVQVFKLLASDPSAKIRANVAARMDCPGVVVNLLACDSESLVAERVANHPNCSVESLSRLAHHNSTSVLLAVAKNSRTPPEALRILSSNSNADVRYCVLKNKHCPASVFVQATEDNFGIIRARVASSIHSPVEALDILSRSDFYEYRALVAANPKCTTDILERLLKDSDKRVRKIATRRFAHAIQAQKADVQFPSLVTVPNTKSAGQFRLTLSQMQALKKWLNQKGGGR